MSFDLKKYLAEGGLEAKLNENEGMSDNDFIKALNKAFAAADDAALEEGEEETMEEGYDPLDEEEVDEGRGRPSGTGRGREVNFKIFTGDRTEENILRLLKQFNKLYTSKKNPTLNPKAKKPRTPFSDEELQNLAALFAKGGQISSKDIIAAIPRYKSPSQANAFLKAMDELGRSKITTVDKKVQDMEKKEKRASGEEPETRGRKKKASDDEFDAPAPEGPTDDELADIEKELGLEENDDFLNEFLAKPLNEDEETTRIVIDFLEDYYTDKMDIYPNVETFVDEVRPALDALIQKYSDDVDM